MHHSGRSIFVCMLLDERGIPVGAEVIEARTLADATELSKERVQACIASQRVHGFELWRGGKKLMAA
jgi:hypothetical protein